MTKIYCDGSTTGACVVVEGQKPKFVAYECPVTNNVGEYRAVIEALKTAQRLGADEVEILTDSQLVVNQVSGNWACRQPHLKPLMQLVWGWLSHYDKSTIKWIPREENIAGKILG